jgi:hypothetical protein
MFPFGVRLSLKERNEDRLELSLSLPSRLMLAFFFLVSCFVLLSGLLLSDKDPLVLREHTVPLILVCLTGLGALYNEKWIFDKNRNIFENHFGLFILSRKQSIPLDGLVQVELDAFTPGPLVDTEEARERPSGSGSHFGGVFLDRFVRAPQRQILRLRVVDKQEKIYVLDSARAHRVEEFRRRGRRIADFCSIPFREN